MSWQTIFKSVLPEVVQREARWLRARCNQWSIQRRSGEQPLHLRPVNLVEHYYHFLFDLALPLYLVVAQGPDQARYLLDEFGIFSDRIVQLFPGRVALRNPSLPHTAAQSCWLYGMDLSLVAVRSAELLAFRQHVLQVLDIPHHAPQHNVLLIERLPPDGYFRDQAVKKGSGASRRSIVNHQELAAALQQAVQPPYRFLNVALENLSFSDQVRLFHSAALVIGQHGAGLANGLWMQPGSHVIEIHHQPKLAHFRILSQLMGHHYHLYKTQAAHCMIDVMDFLDHCRNHPYLGCIL